MDGVEIMTTVLRTAADRPVALVPASIKGGELPEGTPMPALLVRSESLVDKQFLRRGAVVIPTERIAVTVRAATYREARAIIAWVRRAGIVGVPRSMGDATSISVLTAGLGPEMRGPDASYERTQDFRFTYNVPA